MATESHTTKPDWADGGAEMWVGPTRAENQVWLVEEVEALAKNFLLSAPSGLTARTLCDAVVQQGVPEESASLVIRHGLDAGWIRLAANMQLVFH